MMMDSTSGDDWQDPEIAEQAVPAARLPVTKVFQDGYQLIGRHVVSFVTLTVLIGFLIYSLALYVQDHASIGGSVLWRYALGIVCDTAVAALLALVLIPWFRHFILGERQRLQLPRLRELRGIVVAFVVLLAIDGSKLLEVRLVATAGPWLRPLAGIPWLLLLMSFELLWLSLLAAMLMLILPAVAVDAHKPVAMALAAARRDFARLTAAFAIGLAPPIVLSHLAPYLLAKIYLLRAGAPDVMDVQRLMILNFILTACVVVCGFAMAGAAYRALAQDEDRRRTEAFD